MIQSGTRRILRIAFAPALAFVCAASTLAVPSSPPSPSQPLSVDALTGLASLSRLWPLGSLSSDGRWLTFTAPEGRENLIDYWNAVLRWFDTHLAAASGPGVQ